MVKQCYRLINFIWFKTISFIGPGIIPGFFVVKAYELHRAYLRLFRRGPMNKPANGVVKISSMMRPI
ncbi:hypothetical protein BH09BAC4_BH09BAC4_50550 [soil metagenome]